MQPGNEFRLGFHSRRIGSETGKNNLDRVFHEGAISETPPRDGVNQVCVTSNQAGERRVGSAGSELREQFRAVHL
jgi:hypothetical protein